jgi:pimeloyl-ACP methyl ester carboxylesterase
MSADPATLFFTPVHAVGNPARNGHSDVRAKNGDDRRGARARFFGPHGRLFGIFDEPAMPSDRGVVLCYPHGADYDSAFRSFRILATRLSRAGFHVLRFDYLGTGDSLGDTEDGSLGQWTEDTVIAIHELRASCDLRQVSVVGLRLGATVATLAAAESGAVDQLVVWAPVFEGREYLAASRAQHQQWLKDERRSGRAKLAADDDLLGYRLTPSIRSDLENLNLLSLSKLPAQSVYVVNQDPSADRPEFTAWLRARGVSVDTDLIDGPTIWSRTPSMPEATVPNRSLQMIANWIAGTSR